jgi:hypothetical protein
MEEFCVFEFEFEFACVCSCSCSCSLLKEGRSEDEEDILVVTRHKKKNRTEHTGVAFYFLMMTRCPNHAGNNYSAF